MRKQLQTKIGPANEAPLNYLQTDKPASLDADRFFHVVFPASSFHDAGRRGCCSVEVQVQIEAAREPQLELAHTPAGHCS